MLKERKSLKISTGREQGSVGGSLVGRGQQEEQRGCTLPCASACGRKQEPELNVNEGSC